MKREKNPGEKNKYDVIRHILKDYASRENPITRKKSKILQRKWDVILGEMPLKTLWTKCW